MRGNDKWAKKVIGWQMYEGKRRRGRPKLRWRVDITWNRETYDWKKWKKIGESYTPSWDVGLTGGG